MIVETERPDAEEADAKTSKSSKRRWLLPVSLFLLGILFVCYVVGGTVYNNYQQRKVVAAAKKQVAKMPVDKVKKLLSEAEAYNKQPLNSPLIDPWLKEYVPNGKQYQRYLETLGGRNPMGELYIPKINVDLPIYHGTSDQVLNLGLGHLFGSSLPVGGSGTHSVITGHSGLGTATMFDNLPSLKKGDTFYIEVLGRKTKYKVFKTEVVLPHETDDLRVQPNRDLVTLITCTPYGVNTHRLFVHGERVPMENEEANALDHPKTTVWQPWMIWAIVGCLLLTGLMVLVSSKKIPVWVIIRRVFPAKKRETDSADADT